MPERPIQTAAGSHVRHLGHLINRLTRRRVMIGATATAVSSAPVTAFANSVRPTVLDLDDPAQVTDLFLRLSGIPLERPAYSWILSRAFGDNGTGRVALYDQCTVTSAHHETGPDGTRHIESDSITEVRKLETETPLDVLTDPHTQDVFNVPMSRVSHEEMDLKPKFQQIADNSAERSRTRRQISSVVCSDGMMRLTFQQQTLSVDAQGQAAHRLSSEQRTYQANQADVSGSAADAVASHFSYHREQRNPVWMEGAYTKAVNLIGSGGAASSVKDLPPTTWQLASRLT